MKNIKEFFNRDISDFVNKRKIPLICILIVCLLACIGFIVSYAYYQVIDTTPIVGGATDDIADITIRVMAEERDALGQGLGSYGLYAYIPEAGYVYNEENSYCVNGSEIVYNSDDYTADVTATGHDVCYLYFDSTDILDITLYVYAENVDSDGVGTGDYTLLETTDLPAMGYEIGSYSCVYYEDSSWDNPIASASTISYDVNNNLFTVNAAERGVVCSVYMDAIDVDIYLKIYVEDSDGAETYTEVETVPTNTYYELNSISACTGTATLTLGSNQTIEIAASTRTDCVAYLDIASGPALGSITATVDGTSVTVTVTESSSSTTATAYYYSSDGGATYVSSTESYYLFEGLTTGTTYTFMAYSEDASGYTSAILTTTASIE